MAKDLLKRLQEAGGQKSIKDILANGGTVVLAYYEREHSEYNEADVVLIRDVTDEEQFKLGNLDMGAGLNEPEVKAVVAKIEKMGLVKAEEDPEAEQQVKTSAPANATQAELLYLYAKMYGEVEVKKAKGKTGEGVGDAGAI